MWRSVSQPPISNSCPMPPNLSGSTFKRFCRKNFTIKEIGQQATTILIAIAIDFIDASDFVACDTSPT